MNDKIFFWTEWKIVINDNIINTCIKWLWNIPRSLQFVSSAPPRPPAALHTPSAAPGGLSSPDGPALPRALAERWVTQARPPSLTTFYWGPILSSESPQDSASGQCSKEEDSHTSVVESHIYNIYLPGSNWDCVSLKSSLLSKENEEKSSLTQTVL